ncbi:serine hydrolase [Pseudodesulfovibrio cashew]|nr:serine hydrolase [Pseudodesulfovibrio cashew]
MVARPLRFTFALVFALILLSGTAAAGAFEDRLSGFERYGVKGMKDWKVPGMALAVVKGGEVVYAEGFGTRRFGEDLPVTGDTVFQVGSTTKAFTVALMATLVDEGKADWDDRVAELDPAFMMYDPWVTRESRIHDLFAQHSGMPAYAGDALSFLGFGRRDIVRSLRHVKPIYSFRDKFSYVNNLFVAGAEVEERLTGKSWETLMRERILSPLSMTDSSLTEAGLTGNTNNASLHVLVNGTPSPIEPGSMLAAWPYVYGPAGGLNSTARDMARWVGVQLGRGEFAGARLFSPKAADYMHTPQTPVFAGDFHGAYCQGWMRSELKKTVVVWHNGGTSGINSFVGFSPELDLGLVVLTNLGGHKLADALGLQFFDLMSGVESDWSERFLKERAAAEKAEAEEAEATPPSLPGLPPAAYAGTYSSPVYGEMAVTAERNRLMVRFGKDKRVAIRVRHRTMHTFAGDWPEMDPDSPEYHFDFDVTPDGDVASVTIRELHYDGLAVFTRK